MIKRHELVLRLREVLQRQHLDEQAVVLHQRHLCGRALLRRLHERIRGLNIEVGVAACGDRGREREHAGEGVAFRDDLPMR